jgi:hypothetical protein
MRDCPDSGQSCGKTVVAVRSAVATPLHSSAISWPRSVSSPETEAVSAGDGTVGRLSRGSEYCCRFEDGRTGAGGVSDPRKRATPELAVYRQNARDPPRGCRRAYRHRGRASAR